MPEKELGKTWLMPLRVIGWYLGVGSLWILFSDTLVGYLARDPQTFTRMEIAKGWFFLAVTGILLFLLIRRALAIISRREEHYRMLFEKMQNGFAIHEVVWSDTGEPVDFRFLEFNPGFERITGLKAEAVLGKTVREVLPQIEPYWIQMYARVAGSGEPAHFSGYLKDLGRFYEVSAYATEPGRFAVVFSDVTEQRLVEIELKKLHEALEERVVQRTAQYVEANAKLKQEIEQRARAEEEISWLNQDLLRQKSDLEAANRELEAFSFSVSHDLRAPLRHISGFAQLLKEDCGALLDAPGQQYLSRICSSCQTMGKLIDELLELARISRSELHLKKVDLTRMAEAVAAELRQSAPGREVTFRIAAGLEAMGDETLLGIVLQNLLGNAFKYTGRTPAAVIEFGSLQEEGTEVFFVKDNGAGFDMRYADKLFGAFQRLHRKEEFEGTGVGLAIVQRIVHRHGGQIRGEAQPGRGATFTFTLG